MYMHILYVTQEAFAIYRHVNVIIEDSLFKFLEWIWYRKYFTSWQNILNYQL